jgi:hypothetical protein
MHHSIQLTTTIPPVKNPISRSPLRRGFLFVSLGLTVVWLALSPMARAVDPPPDGGYPGQNTAEGEDALFSLTTGGAGGNTAIGFNALFNNTTGYVNTAVGASALFNNTDGYSNTATGYAALFGNTTGFQNTANGRYALGGNRTGSENTANGFAALQRNTTGFGNVANGDGALYSNTTGNDNIAVGRRAGNALTTGSNNIYIGNSGGNAGESSKIRIGTTGTHKGTFIAGISGATVPTGAGVIVGTDGKLGTVVSSERFKDEIKPMDKASEAILALRPVTFHYKHELDPAGIPQFGLVAEQVEKVNPDLVARDEEGKAYTVRYEAVNAMLLNEFLKEHRKVEEQDRKGQEQEARINQVNSTVAKQEVTIAQQQKEIKALTASLQRQAALIQKVSDQLEVSKAAPQLVVNNQ